MYTYLIAFDGAIEGPVELPVVPGMGVQLPSNAVELPELLPAAEAGFVWAWVDGKAVQHKDDREGRQASARAIALRDSLILAADVDYRPLLSAKDLGISTPDERVRLAEWQRYLVDLNRIEKQPGFPLTITWPQAPAR